MHEQYGYLNLKLLRNIDNRLFKPGHSKILLPQMAFLPIEKQ